MKEISHYVAARRELAQACKVDEVKRIRDKAEAIRAYAHMAGDSKLEQDAAEIRIRAERRLGEMTAALKQEGALTSGPKPRIGTKKEPIQKMKLADLGIDKKLSARAQKISSIPDRAFEKMVGELRQRIQDKSGRVPMDIMRAREQAQRRARHAKTVYAGSHEENLQRLLAAGFKAGVIAADPAWQFVARSPKGEGRSAIQHYSTEALEAIKRLPVEQVAADDCVLFLWMVDWLPLAAFEVIEAWGFTHKTTGFTWVKETQDGNDWFDGDLGHMGLGYWTRANPEVCLLATRGSPKRMNADVRQLIVSPVREHSEKPDEVYARMELLAEGPYLELNARDPREGWVTIGNEVEFQLPSPKNHGEEEIYPEELPNGPPSLIGTEMFETARK